MLRKCVCPIRVRVHVRMLVHMRMRVRVHVFVAHETTFASKRFKVGQLLPFLQQESMPKCHGLPATM